MLQGGHSMPHLVSFVKKCGVFKKKCLPLHLENR